MRVTPYAGWPNCITLTNGRIEVVATTDVGPRIIRCGFVGERNLFKEFAGQLGSAGGEKWKVYGGHRLWHAPEDRIRTYEPDNDPIAFEWDEAHLTLTQPIESGTGIRKSMTISVDSDRDMVTAVHRLENHGPSEVELAPWALSVMAPGGRALIPQERFSSHGGALLPARALVLWPYTRMNDPRLTWGERVIQVRQDSASKAPLKIGVGNRRGWAAHALDGYLFVVHAPMVEGAVYTDMGSSFEIFTNADMLEVETLGPLARLSPGGGAAEHTERWHVLKRSLPEEEPELAEELDGIVAELGIE